MRPPLLRLSVLCSYPCSAVLLVMELPFQSVDRVLFHARDMRGPSGMAKCARDAKGGSRCSTVVGVCVKMGIAATPMVEAAMMPVKNRGSDVTDGENRSQPTKKM